MNWVRTIRKKISYTKGEPEMSKESKEPKQASVAEAKPEVKPEVKKPFFAERVYVAEKDVYTGYSIDKYLVANTDLDSAVPCDSKEIEVGIYQLVRVAKFRKAAVEQVTLTEIPKNE
jgi:hypothetical protein